ncbi:MAG: hypothetical protein ABIC40_07105, partial [bacterium]
MNYSIVMRPIRYDIPGHAHGLTFSCFRNQPLFNCDHAKYLFVDSVNSASVSYRFDIWAFVIMPEH